MTTVRLLAAAFIVWALALGYSVRALPSAAAASAQPPSADAPAGAQDPPTNSDCLDCHDDDAAVRENGTPVVVRAAVFAASIHADVACVDCHDDLAAAEVPHAEKLKRVDCSTCHSDAVELFTGENIGKVAVRV